MIPLPLLRRARDRENRSRTATLSLLLGVSMVSAVTHALDAKIYKRLPPIALTPTVVTVVPTSADAFVDAVGADSVFGDTTEPYVTKFSVIGPELAASGIRHLRDAGFGINYDNRMAYLFSHGITHSLMAPIGSSASKIRAILASGNGEVDAIEGPNEYDVDHSSQPNWTGTLRNYQELLYRTVKSDAAGKGINVLGPPLANSNYYSLLGDMESIEDAGSIHESSCDFNPGTFHSEGVANWFLFGRISTPSKPLWTTEAGYTADLTRPCSVPQDVAAKYDTRLIAVYLNDGGSRLYFFQLVDNPANKTFGGKGLIDQHGNPKLQFTAISSLLTLLSDRGAPPAIFPLTYIMSGQTKGVETRLLQRRDGSYDLLIWQEVPSWDHDTRVRIPVPTHTVHITFKQTLRYAHLWTYNASEILSSQAVLVVGSTVSVPVTDSISVLHFH